MAPTTTIAVEFTSKESPTTTTIAPATAAVARLVTDFDGAVGAGG